MVNEFFDSIHIICCHLYLPSSSTATTLFVVTIFSNFAERPIKSSSSFFVFSSSNVLRLNLMNEFCMSGGFCEWYALRSSSNI